jgi:orotidine-5'-phosphate decarboxylase
VPGAALRDRLIVALDFPTVAEAEAMGRRLAGRVGMVKVGLELLHAEGPDAVRRLAGAGHRVFCDCKLHDIPNTVAAAARALAATGAAMLNVHVAGGAEMMRAAKEAAPGVLVIGVTVLTSLDQDDLSALGVGRPLEEQVSHLARVAQEAGLDGVVASAREIRAVREACGPDFLIVTPGIRPRSAAADDQKRVAAPREAIQAGADYIVVGRPITRSRDPAGAAEAVVKEMAG